MKKIVIIGGGFSGTLTAINLARLSSVPLHVFIINGTRIPCRGIAYSTKNGSHLLNVVARNMSALADQPNHFVEWLGTRSEYIDLPLPVLREKFIPRRVYGDYLQNVFQWYSGTLDAEKMRLEWVHDEALDVLTEGQQAKVILKDGPAITADKVILAVGNQAPAPFRLRGLDVHNSHYIGNPWMGWEEKLPSKDQDLLLIGTGLTMVDTFLSLQDLGWQGRLVAVSRHGLLPLSHFKGFDYPELLDDKTAALNLRQIFSIFTNHYRAAQARNLNPAILVDKLRPFTQRIWQNFSLFEKRQFNRHFRTRWNVMRHRIAPEIHRQLREAITHRRLEVVPGRLSECRNAGPLLKITVETHGAKRSFEVGSVINCTGPQESYFPAESILLNNLVSRGTVQVDEMNMGIKIAPNFSVLNHEGRNSQTLFALGSLLRGTLWETTAVPELRSQAFRVAENIADQMAETTVEKHSISEIVEDVIEYFI